jgi:nucleoside-diphosphate-sugar epimerase
VQRIVITGGSSRIATAVRPLLARDDREVALLDVVAPPTPLGPGESFAEVSVLDVAVMTEAVRAADLVVHLAGHPGGESWDEILRLNVDGTQKALQAAQTGGVTRILLASSNHAVGHWRVDELAGVAVPAPRPDSYYGVGKVALEALGSLFADRFGMAVVSARIGSFFDEPRAGRPLATWVSPADIARLIEATLLLDEPGHHVVWGMSDNFPGWFDLSAGRAMGFDPQDDSRHWADEHRAAGSVPPTTVFEGGSMLVDGEPRLP